MQTLVTQETVATIQKKKALLFDAARLAFVSLAFSAMQGPN
jgi:hypothetical protein